MDFFLQKHANVVLPFFSKSLSIVNNEKATLHDYYKYIYMYNFIHPHIKPYNIPYTFSEKTIKYIYK